MGDGAAAATIDVFRTLVGVVIADDEGSDGGGGGGGDDDEFVGVVQMASVESNRNRAKVGRMRKPRGDDDEE